MLSTTMTMDSLAVAASLFIITKVLLSFVGWFLSDDRVTNPGSAPPRQSSAIHGEPPADRASGGPRLPCRGAQNTAISTPAVLANPFAARCRRMIVQSRALETLRLHVQNDRITINPVGGRHMGTPG